jgi:capsular polysaccharide biosynthesis protein/SAM-dependent methyltransferase
MTARIAPEVLAHALRYEASGRGGLEPAMRLKQALVAAHGVVHGFAVFRTLLRLPGRDPLRLLPVASQLDHARSNGLAFRETSRGGERFVIPPARLIGAGGGRAISHVSRTLYVACVADALVRSRSQVIETAGLALLDVEGAERDLYDIEPELDPAIFHAGRDAAWILPADVAATELAVEEAFMLLGPHTGAFGDWMIEYLPRYIAADRSGALPPVPILVDAGQPRPIRDGFEVLRRQGVEVIEVPRHAAVRAGRLWFAPGLHYAPAREKMNERFRWDYLCPAPSQFRPVGREIGRRARAGVPARPGPEKVFLARPPSGWRRLVNQAEIEEIAAARGFAVVRPEALDFAGQVNLMREARLIVAPEGSALFLAHFAPPGFRLMILNHDVVDVALSYNEYFEAADLTILAGTRVADDPQFPHRSDYRIDAAAFAAALDGWMLGLAAPMPAPAPANGLRALHGLGAAERPDLLARARHIARELLGAEDDYPLYRIAHPWLLQRMEELRPGMRVLDIGTGVSPMPLLLARAGLEVECVDGSDVIRSLPLPPDWNGWGFLDYGQIDPRIASHNLAIQDFVPTRRFDAICSIGCLAHLSRADRDALFARCRDWLVPGGRMLHAVDLIPGSDFIWNRMADRELAPPPRHGTVRQMMEQLRRSGFAARDCRIVRAMEGVRTDLLLLDHQLG